MIEPGRNQSDIPEQKVRAVGSIPLSKIFLTFFRIGLLTFGGGLAMAVVMRHELVLKNKWLTDKDFMSEMSLATMVPGAITVNIAYLQGRRLAGGMGALAAVLGTVLPSVIVILSIAWIALPYFSNPAVKSFFRGAALAVAGQLAFAGYTFGRKSLISWKNAGISLLGLILIISTGVHPIWVIIFTGILGYFLAVSRKHTHITPPEAGNR